MQDENKNNDIIIEIRYIRRDLDGVMTEIKQLPIKFSTRDELAPVKNLVYGLVALVMTSFVGALLAIVLNK